MNIKNILIKLLLFLLGITIGIIITLNNLKKEENNTYNNKTIYALINYDKIITLREGDIINELNNEKVIEIKDDYVTISNQDSENKKYNYNEYYEIWANSQNGTLIVEEPEGNIIIKKNIEDIYQYIMNDTNMITEEYNDNNIKFNIIDNQMPTDNTNNIKSTYGIILINKNFLNYNEILKIYYLLGNNKYEKINTKNINNEYIKLENFYINEEFQSNIIILTKNKKNNIINKYKLNSTTEIVY